MGSVMIGQGGFFYNVKLEDDRKTPHLGNKQFKERYLGALYFQFNVYTNPDVPLGTLLNLVSHP